MTREEANAHRMLVDQWTSTRDLLNQLGLAEVRPDDVYRLFKVSGDQNFGEALTFEVGPLTLNVPERAHQSPDLYIVVRGLIHLEKDALAQKRLVTHGFATEVGYFRERSGTLKHVYGTHYDYAYDDVGHPVFHAQMKSYHDRAHWAVEAYELAVNIVDDDPLAGMLRTVRVPTAQMDFFALVVQIVADHLIDKQSRTEDIQTFAELRSLGRKLKGAGHRSQQLANVAQCMRSYHWYPD